MREKYTLSGLVLMGIFLFSPFFNLVAQEDTQQRTPIGKPKIITGMGFETSFSFFTEAGQEGLDDLFFASIDSIINLNFGARIPFLMAFEIAKPYSLGFGVYVSFSYQMSRTSGVYDPYESFSSTAAANPAVKAAVDALPKERVNGVLLTERGEIAFSPVFYNELALGEKIALSLAVGPSFVLSFGEKYSTEIDDFSRDPISVAGLNQGLDPLTTAETAGTFSGITQPDLQFSFGLFLDLGFQVRFNQKIGMSVDTFAKFYFTGQNELLNRYERGKDQIFLGHWGASVSFLLFY